MAKKKALSRKPEESDLGPPEPTARLERIIDQAAAFPRVRRRIENVLDYYKASDRISADQHKAGMTFRRLWILANQLPKIISRYDRIGHGIEVLCERQVEAKGEIDNILRKMTVECRDITVTVCGLDTPAGRGKMDYLRAGLDIIGNYKPLA
ncbi:MAG: hypothetical protein C4523_02395 [Myxococcales bacterium]|nr:MAG: hypothetical protein C4523_02395 [Myxococcales bacterium]